MRIEDIEEIVALTPEAGVSLVLEPLADKHRPRTEYEAKFSLPYSIASLLVRGHVDVSTYTDEAITDPDVLRWRPRSATRSRTTTPSRGAFPGGVRIHTRDGRTLEAELPYQRGGPENPMSAEEVQEKFRTNAGLALSDRRCGGTRGRGHDARAPGGLRAFELLARAARRETADAAR